MFANGEPKSMSIMTADDTTSGTYCLHDSTSASEERRMDVAADTGGDVDRFCIDSCISGSRWNSVVELARVVGLCRVLFDTRELGWNADPKRNCACAMIEHHIIAGAKREARNILESTII